MKDTKIKQAQSPQKSSKYSIINYLHKLSFLTSLIRFTCPEWA